MINIYTVVAAAQQLSKPQNIDINAYSLQWQYGQFILQEEKKEKQIIWKINEYKHSHHKRGTKQMENTQSANTKPNI